MTPCEKHRATTAFLDGIELPDDARQTAMGHCRGVDDRCVSCREKLSIPRPPCGLKLSCPFGRIVRNVPSNRNP